MSEDDVTKRPHEPESVEDGSVPPFHPVHELITSIEKAQPGPTIGRPFVPGEKKKPPPPPPFRPDERLITYLERGQGPRARRPAWWRRVVEALTGSHPTSSRR